MDDTRQSRVEHRSPSPQPSARDGSTKSSEPEPAVQFRHANPTSGNESETDADIDIIAIHGLDTKSPDTWIWKDPKNPSGSGMNWLEHEDMLPKLVGRARISTCDWPADLYEKSEFTQRTTEECARLLLNGIQRRARQDRPIVFIASCLGGIILMKALNMASQGYKSIKTATRGIIFLATPFRGTSFQDIAGWAQLLLKTWAWIQSKNVAMVLRSTMQSSELHELVHAFTAICIEEKYEIFTFYERGATDLFRHLPYLLRIWCPTPKPLVDQFSATLDLVAHPLPLDRFHVTMNKFQGPDKDRDPDYKNVAEKVEYVLEKIREGTPLQNADAYIRNKHYTDEILNIERLSGHYLPMDKCYINLVVVRQLGKEKSESQSSPFSLFSRLMVKTPAKELQVELPTLFDACKTSDGSTKKPRRILIRGRAGVGKTTLCKKIVYDFNHGNIWKNLFKRVLWVPLRNLKSKKPLSFRDLFYHEYFKGETHAGELSLALSQALNTKDERTLFILDGLDEVEGLGSVKDKEYRFLLELLRLPDVIITTRPHATLPATVTNLDLELETIGFYPYQVRCYLEAVVESSSTVRQIQSFLQKHRLIQSLVRIPIQLDAFCLAWNNIARNAIPDTMTGIYKTIVLYLWKKDLVRLERNENPEEYVTTAIESEIKKRTQLENELLERLAISGMCNNLVEFQPEHQNAVCKLVPLPESGRSLHDRLRLLSFLRSSNSPADTSSRSYHFLHLTFQEFFAAQYFVRQWRSGGDLVYLDLKSNRLEVSPVNFLNQHKYNPRYDIVWRFAVGLLDPEREVPRFFEQLEERKLSQFDYLGPTHQRLVMHCLSETKSSTYIESQPELVKNLSQWLLFECELRQSPPFLVDSELPVQVLHTALNDAQKDEKVRILEALKERMWYLSDATIEYLVGLLEEADSDIHSAAIGALTSQSNLPKETVTKLVELLRDRNISENIRYHSAIVLGNQSELPRDIVSTLSVLLQDTDATTQRMATRALQSQSNLPKETVTKLVELLRDRNISEGIRYNSANVLRNQSELPRDIASTLLALLLDTSATTRRVASQALMGRRNLPDEAIIAIFPLLQNNDRDIDSDTKIGTKKMINQDIKPEIQDTLLDIVRETSPSRSNLSEKAAGSLVTLLKSSNSEIKWIAATNLEFRSNVSERTAAALIKLIKDESFGKLATGVLGEHSDLSEQTISALLQLLEDPVWDTRDNAAFILSKQSNLSKETRTTLEGLLRREEDISIQLVAAEIPGINPNFSGEYVATLIARLQTDDPSIRMSIENALCRQANLSEQAITTLMTYIQTDDESICDSAAGILRKQSNLPKNAIIHLITLIQNEKKHVRIAAARALENQSNMPKVLPKETLTAFTKLLKNQKWNSTCYNVAWILGGQSESPDEITTTLVAQLPSETWIRVLEKQSKLSKNTIEAVVTLLKDADNLMRYKVSTSIGMQRVFLYKVLESLESIPVGSETMKYLFGSILYHSFADQLCLHISEDSSLCINQPNGSRKIFIVHSDSHERLSYEELVSEVSEWRKFWNVPNYELR
ncbi:armadillo-type protein [Hypoxylon sp. NC0597]|nr:armadillo-type protein [Hypoxylon sp. NC0597]